VTCKNCLVALKRRRKIQKKQQRVLEILKGGRVGRRFDMIRNGIGDQLEELTPGIKGKVLLGASK
jgi:hypothetical protein